jgi:hypothetical protein
VKTLFSSLKINLRRIVTVTLACLMLIVTTACATTDTQAANPNNQPVQMGGANNPYKNGGDKFTREQGNGQASLKSDSQKVAANSREAELLYPGAETPEGRKQKEAEMPIITEKSIKPKPGGLIQREEGVGERIKDRVETVTESVKDASAFLKDKSDEASARPELKANPAVGK